MHSETVKFTVGLLRLCMGRVQKVKIHHV